jgi:hypothetical protein
VTDLLWDIILMDRDQDKNETPERLNENGPVPDPDLCFETTVTYCPCISRSARPRRM